MNLNPSRSLGLSEIHFPHLKGQKYRLPPAIGVVNEILTMRCSGHTSSLPAPFTGPCTPWPSWSGLKLMSSFFFFFLNNFVLQISKFFFFLILLIYLWLCWVFVSVRGLSLVAASGDHSSSRCAGLSLSRPLLLQSTGSRRAGSAIVAHGPSRSAACGIFPDQGSNPCPLHWQADSQPLRHQGSPSFEPRSPRIGSAES